MSGRKVLARGTVLVDPRKAVEKLRAHQLAQPGLYVLEVVRAATLLGAERISLYNDSDDLALTWEGAAPPSHALAHLLDHLFNATDRALRLLAIAVNSALGLDPSFVDLYTTAHDDLPEGKVALVRYAATGGVLAEGAVSVVDRPEGLAAQGFRLHVRERFGAAVMAEWLRREPAETTLLRARLLAPRVAVTREGAPIRAVSPPPVASVEFEAATGFRATLHLRAESAEPGALTLCELGVMLERRSLEPPMLAAARRARFPSAALPLHLVVDADALDTNISRAQVDLDRGLGPALARRWPAAIESLVSQALEGALARPVTDPSRAVAEESLLALVLWAHGESWAEAALRAEGAAVSESLGAVDGRCLDALSTAPLIPTPTGGRTTLRELARSGASWALWTDDEGVAAEFAPWLRDVVWAPASRPVLRALLSTRTLRSGSRAMEEARAAMKRWRALMAHPVRPVRVEGRGAAVLRADLARQDDPLALVGELAVFEADLRREQCAIEAEVFLDGRVFARATLGASALSMRVAVQSPRLAARPAFDGILQDAGLAEVVRAIRARFVDAVAQAAAEGALDALTPRARASLARAAWIEARACVEDSSRVREALARRVEGSPALAAIPAWETTHGEMASTAEVLRLASATPRAVLTGPSGAGPRLDGRPVLVLDLAARQALAALVPEDARWIDLRDHLPASQTREPWRVVEATLPDAAAMIPWWTIRGDGARLSVAPSPTTKSTLTLLHAGRVVVSRARAEALGPSVIALEDDALIPTDDGHGELPGTLSQEATALMARAEHALAASLCDALHGDRAAREALGWSRATAAETSVRRFLLAALARLPQGVGEDAALRARIEALPLIPQRTREGAVAQRAVGALRDAIAQRGATSVEFLVAAPEGLDGEDFTPLILPTKALRSAVERALGVKVVAGEKALRAAVEARARRAAREALRRRDPARLEDTAGMGGGPVAGVLDVEGEGRVAYALAPELSAGRACVLLDDAVAVTDALGPLPYPLVARVALADPAGFGEDFSSLTKPGRQAVEGLVRRAATALALAAVARAEAGEEVGPAERRMVSAWVNTLGRKSKSRPELSRARLCAARIWRGPDGARRSIDDARAGEKAPAVLSGWGAPWLPPGEGEAPDAPTLLLARQEELDAVRALAGGARDVSESARITQRRRRFARGDAATVRLPDAPLAPWATARLEEVMGPRAVGEVRLASRAQGAEVTVFEDGAAVARAALPCAVGLDLALASPEVDASRAAEGLASLDPVGPATELAHRMLRAAIARGEAGAAWCEAAVRWHLLRVGDPSAEELDLARFVDAAGRPMSLRDMDLQRERFGVVAFVARAPEEPVAAQEPGRRVVVLSEGEAALLAARRPVVDHRAVVAEDLAAARWERAMPSRAIAVPSAPTARTLYAPLTAREDGYEGELFLLPWDAPEGGYAHWYTGRRPLGGSHVAALWPARLAMEVPALRPRRDRSGPQEDDALHAARADAAAIVAKAVERALAPAAGEALAWIPAHEGRSPAMSGGAAMAVGCLWLTRDGARGEVLVEEGAARLRVAARLPERVKGVEVYAPIAGHLWLRRGVSGKEVEPLVRRLVAWSWRRLLERWSAGATIDPTDPATLTHLVAATLAGQLPGALAERTRRATLPGSEVPVSRVAQFVKQGRAIAVAEGGGSTQDAVPRSDAPWFRLLAEVGALKARERPAPERVPETAPAGTSPPARPAERPVVPATPPRAATAAERLGERLTSLLHALGVPRGAVRAVRVLDGHRGGRPMGYRAEDRTAWVSADAPLVAWALRDPAADDAAALALLGEVNRALDEVTDAHEADALRALIAKRASAHIPR